MKKFFIFIVLLLAMLTTTVGATELGAQLNIGNSQNVIVSLPSFDKDAYTIYGEDNNIITFHVDEGFIRLEILDYIIKQGNSPSEFSILITSDLDIESLELIVTQSKGQGGGSETRVVTLNNPHVFTLANKLNFIVFNAVVKDIIEEEPKEEPVEEEPVEEEVPQEEPQEEIEEEVEEVVEEVVEEEVEEVVEEEEPQEEVEEETPIGETEQKVIEEVELIPETNDTLFSIFGGSSLLLGTILLHLTKKK